MVRCFDKYLLSLFLQRLSKQLTKSLETKRKELTEKVIFLFIFLINSFCKCNRFDRTLIAKNPQQCGDCVIMICLFVLGGNRDHWVTQVTLEPLSSPGKGKPYFVPPLREGNVSLNIILLGSDWSVACLYNIGNVGQTASMSMLTLFESRYTLKARYNIGNVGQTASMSMHTLFESRYTLKGRYNIGNVGQTASMSMLTLFESRYTLKARYSIGNVGQTASMSMLTLFESRHTLKGRYNIGNGGQTDSMSMLTLFESRYTLKARYSIGNVGQTASMGMHTLFESRCTTSILDVTGSNPTLIRFFVGSF